MVLTLSDCAGLIQHGLGRVLSPQLDAARVTNLAGIWFTSAHPWAFLERPATGLDFVAGQSYCDLPTDFGELRSVEVNEIVSRFIMSTSSEVNYMRSGNVDASGLVVWGAINYSSTGTPRLDVYPTPGANVTDALNLYYRAKWTRLVVDTDTANIPDYAEPAFIDTLIAYALGLEERDTGSLSRRLADVREGAIREAILMDQRGQDDYGQIINGAASMNAATLGWNRFLVE